MEHNMSIHYTHKQSQYNMLARRSHGLWLYSISDFCESIHVYIQYMCVQKHIFNNNYLVENNITTKCV